MVGSVLYFLPVFNVFLIGMVFRFTGIELVIRIIGQLLDNLKMDYILFERALAHIYYMEFFFLPYWAYVVLLWSGKDWYEVGVFRDEFSSFFIVLGLMIMFLGVSKWIDGKMRNKGLVTTGIYRYTRHPQYLGYILWGYGVMVFSTHRNAPFQHPIVPTLNWVLSSLMIVGVALIEEIKLRKEMENYSTYTENTSFLIPLPRFVRKLMAHPWEKLWKNEFPRTIRQVGLTLMILFVLLTIPRMVFGRLYDYELFREYGKTINLVDLLNQIGL